jgi:chromosome partitioning protein
MISVAFANLKPGTTKTTSAVMLAAEFHRRDLSVLLVDNDPAGSALRWADLANGFPWQVIGMPTRQISRELPALTKRMDPDVVIIDTPQMEDHADKARAALTVTDHWIVPVAPAGIEVDRTKDVFAHMDQVDAIRPTDAHRLVFFTRTNKRRPSKNGPDAVNRDAFRDHLGVPVFCDQVPFNDTQFRQTYAELPATEGTAYETLADYLVYYAPDHDGFAAAWAAEQKAKRDQAVYGVSNA